MAETGPDYFHSNKKRGVDITGGLLLARLLAGPAVAAAAVTMAEHGPRNMFFRQLRRANRDQDYIITKFTTLVDSVDDITEREMPLLLTQSILQ